MPVRPGGQRCQCGPAGPHLVGPGGHRAGRCKAAPVPDLPATAAGAASEARPGGPGSRSFGYILSYSELSTVSVSRGLSAAAVRIRVQPSGLH